MRVIQLHIAQSPESGHQGLSGNCGNERYDTGAVRRYLYSVYSGPTQNLAIVPQPSEAPDPSAQAEGEPHWPDGTATESPPPPYHEHDKYLVHHAHGEEMVRSFGSPQTLLEVPSTSMERTPQQWSGMIIEMENHLAGYCYISGSTPLHGEERYHILWQLYYINYRPNTGCSL